MTSPLEVPESASRTTRSHGWRSRHCVVLVASIIALFGGGLVVAPVASASDESVQVSSFSSGVGIGGSASMKAGASQDIVLQVDFPSSLVTAPVISYYGADVSRCLSEFGITISWKGINQVVDGCETFIDPAAGGKPEIVALGVFTPNNGTRTAIGDEIVVTWNDALFTSRASLSGTTVWVWNYGVDVPVTLALAPQSGSLSSSSPIPIWMQAVGRSSSDASCPDGFTPSWDTWPNGGKGGWVCNRFVPAYGR